MQGLHMSETGCNALDDAAFAYGTGLNGGWVRGWEFWVNPYPDADGNPIGGWACIRTIQNRGGTTWLILSP